MKRPTKRIRAKGKGSAGLERGKVRGKMRKTTRSKGS
jgi:hypothetical protein